MAWDGHEVFGCPVQCRCRCRNFWAEALDVRPTSLTAFADYIKVRCHEPREMFCLMFNGFGFTTMPFFFRNITPKTWGAL
jgi:hypothetical protein